MQLSSSDTATLGEIADVLASDAPEEVLRRETGLALMRLLRADFLASFVWDAPSRSYRSGISVNMNESNIQRYHDHFQFHDPVTPAMSIHRQATIVEDVFGRRELDRTEFYRDFLARDGLHSGLNYFAYAGSRQLGDLRLWRAKGTPFTESDRIMLELVGRVFAAQLAERARAEVLGPGAAGLTQREREIVAALAEGLGDAAIASRLHLSVATVRTHLSHVFQKLGVGSRLEVVAALREPAKINDSEDVRALTGR